MKTKEIFKDIPEYEGLYQVSNLGRVKSLKRKIKNSQGIGFRTIKERILKSSPGGGGLLQLELSRSSKGKHFKVHQLVAIVFLNHKPNRYKGLVVDHINNINTDNRLLNLQLITHRENCSKDKKHCSSKYTGVHFNKKLKKWRSIIYLNGKSKNLGVFTEELKAAEAYKNELKKLNYEHN